MKNVLIIDDDDAIAELLEAEIGDAFADVDCHSEADFENAADRLRALRPDVVILDLRRGVTDADRPGEETWRLVWEGPWFCPIVIYSAVGDDLTPPLPDSHPFVKRVVKGSGSEADVIAYLRGFAPQIEALAELRAELEVVLQSVLRDTAGSAIVTGEDSAKLVHVGRRRVAALMDVETATEGRKLYSWEKYLIPPVGDSPLTADLIRERGAPWDSPAAYRLVLTPSCDMVRDQGPCATVLVARCLAPDHLVRKMSLSTKKDKAEERLRKEAMSPGSYAGLVPLPAFEQRIPNMVASMKDLAVVAYESIVNDDPDAEGYERVASIDSPFREAITWAFKSSVARPGLPDRDLETWAAEFLAEARKKALSEDAP